MNYSPEDLHNLGTEEARAQLPYLYGHISVWESFIAVDAVKLRDRLFQLDYFITSGEYLGDPEWINVDIIDCGGGGLEASFAGCDMLRAFCERHNMKLRVNVYGGCYSAAAMIILQYGDERLSTPHSLFLLHEPRQFSWDTETISNLEDRKEGIEKSAKKVFELMADRSGHTVDEARAWVDRRENWLSAEEMIEKGLLDGIIQ